MRYSGSLILPVAFLTLAAIGSTTTEHTLAGGPPGETSRPVVVEIPEPAVLRTGDDLFATPVGLESAVEFWRRVYADLSEHEVVFHDRDDLGIVYEKIYQRKWETREQFASNEAAQEAIIQNYRRILLDLAARNPDPRTLSGDYEDVYELFGRAGNPERWRQAADRIRVQRGLKERFHRGLLHAGQYRPHILRIFEQEGVPAELAWLPMVESTFNIEARSSVGAAGVWQFMPGTGKLYMRVDATVDERLDPIIAARGAARLLKHNYQGLGAWPLAITAYNHGYYGMRRAVREVGTTDYMTIRRYYRGPAFGFASQNFYAEFLAALHVAENSERYFGVHQAMRGLEFDEVVVPASMPLRDIAAAVHVDPSRVWELNPSLTAAVWRGERSVPSGFRMRVPPGYGREAPMQLASAAQARTGTRTRPVGPAASASTAEAGFHTVQRGDTLASIASRHGTTITQIVSLNGIRDRNHIRVGQRLRVR
ncbi:MAG TPA: transglycosylase SLT domain-containing protein [Gemmatimonadota bacterium]|nr:transglycosylase SLT domain-containing protein [Gemmatimonadota bacterium]